MEILSAKSTLNIKRKNTHNAEKGPYYYPILFLCYLIICTVASMFKHHFHVVAGKGRANFNYVIYC